MYTRDLFEGISEDVIEKSLNNIKNNLHKIRLSPHTKYHCGQTDEFLQNRIYDENKRHSTSFYTEDVKEIKDICIKTILANWDKVTNFLLGYFCSDAICLDFHKALGFGYLSEIQGVFEDLHLVKVCLVKDECAPCGFVVSSVFPVITRDIKPDESVEWLREEAL